MLIKEAEKKYTYTVNDLLKTLNDYGIIPENYIEVKKIDAKKTKK